MRKFCTSLVAAALVLAACGTGADDPAGSAPPAPATAPSTGTSSQDATSTTTATAPTAGVPALLRFTGTTLQGEAFDGAGLAGSPVVFWFWAPWCPKCQADGPSV